MKRLFCILTCIFYIFSVLVFSVFALESYIFYPFEPVQFYSDSYDLIFDPDSSFYFFDGDIPDGDYILSGFDDNVSFSSDSFTLLKIDPGYDFDIPAEGYCSGSIVCYTKQSDGFEDIVDLYFEMLWLSDGGILLAIGSASGHGVGFITNPLTFTRVSSDEDFLGNFLFTLKSCFVDLGISSLAIVLIAPLVLCSVLVFCWFGYRFIKRKIVDSVMKGKM